MTVRQHTNGVAQLAMKGFIAIGAFIGYEWFMSGLTKIVRGGFPSGLAGELHEKSVGAPSWYKSFLDGTVIPNGKTFGIMIESSELAIGIISISAAALALWCWKRFSHFQKSAVLVAVMAASVGAILMNINFHLANGSSHPWLIPKDGFDEGVDMDSLLPLLQLTFLIVCGKLLYTLRRG